MCGIAGYLTGRRSDPGLLTRMCDALCHRGPDDEGYYSDGPVRMGMRRLSVIDLESGHQPISNEDDSVVIVFNGEIYNFRELRAGLERRGHRFRTETDTECIVHLYEDVGDRCVEHLRGMFAFAIWDRRRQTLLLARDRIGKKPLYYRLLPDGIAFASELKALLQDSGFPRDLDPIALDQYLAYQYVPAPLSIFSAARKLPPAHTLMFAFGDRLPALRRYWTLQYEPKLKCSEPEAVELMREAIRDATRVRLVADRPIGAFLSGGLDSSVVVAFMAEYSEGAVQTFSIGFEEAAWDERRWARLVAERLGTEHHEAVVRPDVEAILPSLAWHYDEPFADSSAIPSWYLAKMTRSHVTVALNGDGGDENFGGYERYLAALMVDRLPLSGASQAFARHLYSVLPARGDTYSRYRRARRVVELAATEPTRRYGELVSCFRNSERERLYGAAWGALLGEPSHHAALAATELCGGLEGIDRLLSVDAHTYLPGDLLVKMDIATMAHSLEARSPLLDHKVMELAARMPGHLKIKGLRQKVLLKEVARGLLPEEVIHRKKHGFGVPIGAWLRSDLKDMAHDLLGDQKFKSRGYFDDRYVKGLLAEHMAGEDHSPRIWALLQFELWARTFLDGPALPKPVVGRRR